ncbi:MAG: hypothetical protein VX583_13150 [Bdellovibrionota bacterium]
MEKTYRKNVVLFFVTSLLLIGLILGHSFWIDSFDYWGKLRDRPALNNPHKLKLDFIRNQKFNCIILGSSRAESFSPYQLSEITGYDCVNLAVGGASTALKRLYLEESKKHQDLKYVLYVSDFYEFFEGKQPEEVLYHPELGPLVLKLDESVELPNLLQVFLLMMDNVRFNRDTSAFKKGLVEKELLDQKATKPGLRLYKYLEDADYVLRRPEELDRDWKRNFMAYSSGVWQGKYVTEKHLELIQHLNSYEKEGVKVRVLLSPFYSKFNDLFLERSSSQIKQSFVEWKSIWSAGSLFKVVNYSGDISSELPQTINFWDDGVHLNKFGAAKLLDKEFK